MSDDDRSRWNKKYSERQPPEGDPLDDWLHECLETMARSTGSHISKGDGRAADLACGLGHNACGLSKLGWHVDAVDISDVGLRLAQRRPQEETRNVTWITADLDDWNATPAKYDLIVVFRFLDRRSVPRIVHDGLADGGWLVFETFSADQLQRADNHLRNPDFALKPGELTQMFSFLAPISHRRDVLADRSVERLLAQKPSVRADDSKLTT